jgi:hypothetical protein
MSRSPIPIDRRPFLCVASSGLTMSAPSESRPRYRLTPLEPRGLRIRDAAAYGGVTVWFIRSAIWAGKLKARKGGSVQIILREDLDAFLNSLPEVEPLHPGTS